MRYIYKNITPETKILTLLSEDKSSVSSVPLGANSRLEISNNNLDIYVPHILARIDEHGNDISHLVLRAEKDEVPVVVAPLTDNEPISVPVILPIIDNAGTQPIQITEPDAVVTPIVPEESTIVEPVLKPVEATNKKKK